jgi:hypothetical protein
MKLFVCISFFVTKIKFSVLYRLGQLQLKISEKLSVPPNRQKFTNNWTYKQYTDQVCLFFKKICDTYDIDCIFLDFVKRSQFT